MDYERLWKGMKDELEFQTTHHDLEMITEGVNRGNMVRSKKAELADKLLSRMNHLEALELTRAVQVPT